MGEYTTITFEAKIKPQYVEAIKSLDSQIAWNELGYDFADEYGKVPRASFIPRGGCANHRNELIDGVWYVHCAVKDYEGTFKAFRELVMTEIVEELISMQSDIEGSYDWGIDYSEWTYNPITKTFTETQIPSPDYRNTNYGF